RGNPFANDFFNADRWGASAGHTWAPRREMTLSTNLYGAVFRRDWWRQSSNSRQRPNDSADPLCGGMANLHSTCGNEGRLRDYSVWGIEPKMRAGHRLGEADFGLRLHFENQERIQQNGQTPTARAGPTVENNRRQARAVSSFAQNQFRFGRWTVTPGLRYERVHYRRLNRLLSVSGENSLTNLIPGLGVAFNPSDRFTFFAGAHRGFAPPRVEDVINNSTGASIELDPELSWNYEAGARARLSRSLRLEATLFRMDFSNQIVPSSVAGGLGAALTNAGETLHQGAELSGRWDWRSALGTRHSFHLRGAWTWLPEARYEGQRYSTIPGFSRVLVTRNRLPYAPEHLLNASLGYSHTSGLNAMLESVLTGRQFGDDLNTRNGTPDGQQGILPGNAIWNATVNYPVEPLRASLFFAVKNLLNRTVIVDRSRGLLPGIPRLAQVGLQFSF
ncbi:MAG: TonB-dependent receptor, partial [Acidobacteria bacterium]|nr:TonB-dependent receptor [Acidobacteriota bacterium]